MDLNFLDSKELEQRICETTFETVSTRQSLSRIEVLTRKGTDMIWKSTKPMKSRVTIFALSGKVLRIVRKS